MEREMRREIFKIKKVTYIELLGYGEYINNPILVTAVNNLISLGFIPDEKSFKLLSKVTSKELERWYFETTKWIKEFYGGDHKYLTFYPKFPNEVMDKDPMERLLDQIMHYYSGYRPSGTDEKDGIKSLEDFKLKVITVADYKNFPNTADSIWENYIGIKSNLSETEINYISTYLKYKPTWFKMFENKSSITNRTLICSLIYTMLGSEEFNKYDGKYRIADNIIEDYFVTNDFLRMAVLLSNLKSYNLNEAYNILMEDKMILGSSIPRKYRRVIVKGLSHMTNMEEDVARNLSQFKVLFKIIHAGEYKNIASDDFNRIVYCVRNNIKLKTFYSEAEDAMRSKDKKKIRSLYKSRPGEFVKVINRLLKIFKGDEEFVYDLCKEILYDVRVEDLYGLVIYLERRKRGKYKVHKVNGQLYVSGNNDPIDSEIAANIQNIAKTYIYDKIGVEFGIVFNRSTEKIYIDERLRNFSMPTDIANTSDNIESYTKGSRIDIDNNKNLRFGIWWTNNKDNKPVDIDLSATFYNKNMEDVGSISYASSFSLAGCVHSGDITNGGKADGDGAAEFIDVPIDKLKENNISYVRFYINVFNGKDFSQLENCEFTIQERKELDKSEKYNIKAVKQKSRLTTASKGITPCIFDVENNQIIWTDCPNYKIKTGTNVFDTNVSESFSVLMDMYGTCYLSMYDIISGYIDFISKMFKFDPITNNISDSTMAFTVDKIEKYSGYNITVKDMEWIDNMMTEAPEHHKLTDYFIREFPVYHEITDYLDSYPGNSTMEVLNIIKRYKL